MWHMIFALLIFLLTIFMVAGFHEFGHFIFARLFGIKVLRFSIGFGKGLWRCFDKHGTEYMLALFPIGGYVKLLDSREGPVAENELAYAFDKRPLYQRFCVILAGPIFNFLLAILAFAIIYTHGVTYIKPIVGEITTNSIAARAGIQTQDQIVAIGKRDVLSWSSVVMALFPYYGETGELNITVRQVNNQQRVEHVIALSKNDWHLNALRPDLLTSIGIKPYLPAQLLKNQTNKSDWPKNIQETTHYTATEALLKAVNETSYFLIFNSLVLYKMVTGTISLHSLGGPISIFQAAVNAANYGIIVYLNFLALISISIGFLNLLPIPGLDGAQIIYLFYELIRGKPPSIAAQILAFRLGVILLMLLMLQALLNDLARLV